MATTATTRAVASAKTLTLAAHAAFVPIGVVTVLLGPLLPWLSARWGLTYQQAGSLFTAQFGGATLGVLLSGVLAARWGFRFAIKTGLLIIATAVALLPYSSHAAGIICVALYGYGYGVSVPAANLMVAEVNPARRSAALNLLNFSWSVGAVACPFLIAAAIRKTLIPPTLTVLAGIMLLVVAGIQFSGGIEPAAAVKDAAPASLRWRDRSFLVLAALFFLYVGTETALGGWVASYSRSVSGASTIAVMTPSFFYMALMLGRWFAPILLRTIDEVNLARGGILLACVATAALIASASFPAIAVSSALAGLGLSTIYPITISLLSRQFGARATRVGSFMFFVTNLGGASLPWLVGFCSTRFGAIKAGLVVPLVAGVAMLALYFTKWNRVLA